MSSVCGIMTVKTVIETNPGSKKKFIICGKDPTGLIRFLSNTNYPIGTRIYWEHWYRDNKWAFMPLDQ